MAAKPLILVISDDLETRCALAEALRCGTCDLLLTSTVSEALANREPELISLVFCQDRLPDGSFRDVLRSLKTAGLHPPLVVCSLSGEIDEYLDAMQLGAFDFIPAPYRQSEVEAIAAHALGRHWLKRSATAAGSRKSNSIFEHKEAS